MKTLMDHTWTLEFKKWQCRLRCKKLNKHRNYSMCIKACTTPIFTNIIILSRSKINSTVIMFTLYFKDVLYLYRIHQNWKSAYENHNTNLATLHLKIYFSHRFRPFYYMIVHWRNLNPIGFIEWKNVTEMPE